MEKLKNIFIHVVTINNLDFLHPVERYKYNFDWHHKFLTVKPRQLVTLEVLRVRLRF